MTLQELRYLVAVADSGSFSDAAAMCFVTQPTLSTQLKKLEQDLGVRLVERTNKSVHITPVGEKVVERARQALNECENIRSLARTYNDPYAEPFRVGIIATLGPYLLPKLLPAIRQARPAMKMVVQEGLTHDLLARLAEHSLDCAIVALPVPQQNLSEAVLFEEKFWLVCQRDHALGRKKCICESDLDGQPVLLLAEGHCLRDQALALCGDRASTELERGESYRATSLETLRHLVAAGFGCTLMPALALREELARDSPTKAVPFQSGKIGRTIGLVWRPSTPRAAVLEQLAKFIRKRSAAWLAGKA